jgi:hypothetical protein
MISKMNDRKKCQKITEDVILVYFLSKLKALKSYCKLNVNYFYSLGNNSILVLLNEHVMIMIRVEMAITRE